MPAFAAVKFSAIAVDARNGKVLYGSDVDGLRHPASLTKVMTLYILFQELKAKRLTLSSPLRASARASRMPPSKLGLKAGQTLTVEDAIKALVTRSANDVASIIAENLGGSESAFAARMTKTARAIGMKRTTFRNASGLPNPNQVTTARDMATLSLRIQRDFPNITPISASRPSPGRARSSAPTTGCSANSPGPTASRPAISAPRASTSHPRPSAATSASSAW